MTSNPGIGLGVHIETYGCQMNVYDTTAIFGILAEHGCRRCDDLHAADVVLLNTCSVRDHAEHRVISRIGELRKLRRENGMPRFIGVCGCMAERMGGKLLEGVNHADLVVGVDSYEKLPGILAGLHESRREDRVAAGHDRDVHYVAPPLAYPTNNSHLVTIHKGCDYRCTYCIVPETRGPQQEKPLAVIMAEIAGIVAGGGREVTLLGQNVTAYNAPEADFAALLRRVAGIDGLERIRFLTGHPHDMDENLIRTIGELDKVCPWLHVPAQSGSDRVLRRMKRLYTRADYLRLVEHARSHIRDVTFSGDFIVGFPGESDDDFRQTLELVREVGYDQTFNFKYSERPGTPASRLEDDVPDELKKDRLARLLAVQQESWLRLADEQVGGTLRVVVEGPARRPAGTWRARSANNRKVLIGDAPAELGDVIDVEITGYEATTFRGKPRSQARR